MKLFGKSHAAPTEGYKVIKSDEDWRKILSPEQFAVMLEHATERPGSSPLLRANEAASETASTTATTAAGCIGVRVAGKFSGD